MLGTIIGNVYGIKLGHDVVKELDSLDQCFDGSNDGSFEWLFLEDSLVSTDGKVLGSDEGISLSPTDGKVLGTIPGNVYGITLGIDFESELGYLDGSFDGFNVDNLEGLFLGD